jgi:uncharacterized BrkB/YihY/UPF0761 family membrane protein
MEHPFDTIKGRISQVVYVVFATIGLLAVLGGAASVIYCASVFASGYPEAYSYRWLDATFGGVVWIGIGLASYIFGWTFRWVVTGRTASVLAGLKAIYRSGEAPAPDERQ